MSPPDPASQPAPPRIEGLADVMQALQQLGRNHGQVSVADARETFGERSIGPFLFLPALLEITPLGAIPTVPTLLAAVILFFSIQLALGKRHLWLPGWLERRHLAGDKLCRAAAKLEKYAAVIDRLLKPRWHLLAGRNARRAIALLCIALCLTVPPLELVPFASTVPMLIIAVFGLAITVRDGLLIAIGLTLALGGGVFGLLELAEH